MEKATLIAEAQQTRTTHPWIAEGERTIRYGILSNIQLGWEHLLENALRAEELGYDSVCIYDHPTSMNATGCWTTLAMLAVATTRLRLISLVSCAYYYHPVVLARMAADVDRASHGRLVLGLGMGDDEHEFEQLGIPFPPARQRQKFLEETIQIIQGLWKGEELTYQGTHFQIQRAAGHPLPVQYPYVPLLIAGGGEQVTLRQVAQYADVSNFGPHMWTGSAYLQEDVTRKYETLRAHCETFARAPETILRSYFVPSMLLARTSQELEAKRLQYPIHETSIRGAIVGTIEEIRERFQTLVNLGVQYFILPVYPADPETLEIFASDIMPTIQHS